MDRQTCGNKNWAILEREKEEAQGVVRIDPDKLGGQNTKGMIKYLSV